MHILPATHLELDIGMREFNSAGLFRMALKFFTLLPETNEKVMFTDCSNIPYEIKLSDEENFYVDSKSRNTPDNAVLISFDLYVVSFRAG